MNLKENYMEILRLRPECIRCVTKRHLENFPKEATTEQKLAYMQGFMRIIADARPIDSAPFLVHAFDELREELFGCKADYTNVKTHFNKLMLNYEDRLWKNIEKAEEPLKLAIQYAMVGNFIDFGAMENVDEVKLGKLLDIVTENPVSKEEYEQLQKDLSQGQNLVYITDNCGEIVLDKLLLRTIQNQYPHLNITVIVRSGDVLNDATLKDAEQTGLTNIFKVIGNGNNIAGTVLEKISDEAKEVIETADVMIAKGQANFETLRMCGRNVYYIFMCKCEMFARNFNVPQYTGMLVNDKRLEIK